MQLIWNRIPASLLMNLAFVAVVFILDIVTPLGTPVWILYFLAFFFIPSKIPQHYPLNLAGLCTILILIGYLLSSEGALEPLPQRGLVIIALWVYAMILTRRRTDDEDED